MFFVDCARIIATTIGTIVILMWIAGVLGLGQFVLTFRVGP